MKNILVPTDFSKNAKCAFLYAQELALYLDGKVKIINVAHPTLNTNYSYVSSNIDEEVAEHKKRLETFVKNSLDQEISAVLTKTKIEQEVVIGFAAEEIIELSSSDEVDLIIMGTTGLGGVLDQLLGSVSKIVAQNAKCPVLLVPEGSNFKDFNNILYASDFESSDNKLLEEIADFAGLFKATVHLVHVQEKETNSEFAVEELVLDQIFEERAPAAKLKYVTVLDTDIWHGLNVYARDSGVDLMVFVRPKRKFWKSIFHKSVTKRMMNNPQMPMLILPIQK